MTKKKLSFSKINSDKTNKSGSDNFVKIYNYMYYSKISETQKSNSTTIQYAWADIHAGQLLNVKYPMLK